MAQEIFDSGGPIILAHVQPFRLGAVEAHPSTRQIIARGKNETLEPRVMQVLVALAQAEGAVVATDELILRCWDGRIVGENAIHRVISRVRHIAATIGGGSFRIETIAKVGYRLVVDGGARTETSLAHRSTLRSAWLRRHLAIPLIAALLAAAGLGAWLWKETAAAIPTIAVVPSPPGATGLAPALARGLSVDLARLPAGREGGLAVIDPSPGAAAPATDYLARVSAESGPGGLRADVSLLALPTARTLWSASFATRSREIADLRQQVAAVLGSALGCLAHGDRPGSHRLDPTTLQLYLAACGRSLDDIDATQLGLLRRITGRAPGFAPGWARLALVEALTLPDGAAGPPQRAATSLHIRQARSLNPNLGETYLAEAEIGPDRNDWRERLRLYERGIALDPDFAPLHAARSFELTRVGRMQDAVREARRSVELDPLSVDSREVLISSLAYAGDVHAAGQELDRAERIWPGARLMRALRYRFELRFGDARRALTFQSEPDLFDVDNPPTDRAFEAFLRARIDPTPDNIDRAVAAFMPRYPDRVAGLIQTLAYFQRVDQAYQLLDSRRAAATIRGGSEVLFRPQMRALRNDPRFIALAFRIGLLRYWQESGIWPDFCLDPQLPYDCRAKAARLSGPRG